MTIETAPTFSNETYKNYSLEQLKVWIQDATQSGAEPYEIYGVIVEALEEDIQYHSERLNYTNKMLDLMKGKEP